MSQLLLRGFLSGTTLFAGSVPYLKHAIEVGVQQAHYTLAFVYIKQHDTNRALREFKAFLIFNPDNETAKNGFRY